MIRYTRLNEFTKHPVRKHTTDAGIDLFADKGIVIAPHSVEVVPTGVVVAIPDGFVGQVWAKSRSRFIVGAGIVDSGYRGQVYVRIFNVLDEPLIIHEGDAIAQLVVVPVLYGAVVEDPSILEEQTERGATGGILQDAKA